VTGPALETARLRLRSFERADVDALHAHWTDPDVRRYLWDGIAIPRQQAADVVEASIASFAGGGLGFWVLLVKDGGAFVGFTGFRAIEAGPDIELFYALDPPHWRRGFATEAARRVLRYAFDEAGLARIVIRTDSPNTASIEVMRRLGARYVRTDPVGAFGGTIVYDIGPEALAACA
jgi:RimJ/RimL family protein N-acetyltransferase